MKMIMIWYAFSTLFSSIGLKTLRRANIPVSVTVMDGFELLVLLIPGCSVVYSLLSRMLFEVDVEIRDSSSIYKDALKCLEDGSLKRSSAFYICAAILQYFGFSLNIWISSLIYALLLLANQVKPDLRKSQLSYILPAPLLFFPGIFMYYLVCVVPFFHLLVAAPYFKTLITTSSLAAHAYGQKKYIEIVCGMLANVVAAYYLRLQSADLMLALLSFAIASLGVFENAKPFTDFGIIQFLVTSSIQFAVSQFGLLHVHTCLVFLVGFAVMVCRWKMDSVHLAEPERWGRKLWPFLIKTERAADYLSPILVVLPLIFFLSGCGNIRRLMLLSVLTVGIRILRREVRFLEDSAREDIISNVWNWKWWQVIGNSSSTNGRTPFFYTNFRDILHRFLQHMMCRRSCRPNGLILPEPV